jgi:hypothetical protein
MSDRVSPRRVPVQSLLCCRNVTTRASVAIFITARPRTGSARPLPIAQHWISCFYCPTVICLPAHQLVTERRGAFAGANQRGIGWCEGLGRHRYLTSRVSAPKGRGAEAP